MDIKFSGKYKLQNEIDTSIFNSKLINTLTRKLENKRASVSVDNEVLKYQTPFILTLISTKMNLGFRLFWFGKGKIWWKQENEVVKFNYLINLAPILISSLILTLIIVALMTFTGNFSTYFLIRNSLFLILIISAFGFAISKARINNMIKESILENS